MGVLRRAIARIEGDGIEGDGSEGDGSEACTPAPAAWPSAGQSRTNGQAKVPLGRDLALDRVMLGGLGRGALHEVVAATPGDAGAASGFALALAARFAAASGDSRAPIVWIIDDRARAETGVPYAPGLRAHGIDPRRFILVTAVNGRDSLWAMEEALKIRAAAVLVELWRTRLYDLVASRRLVLAAARSGTPGVLVPAGVAGAAALSSAARTRFEIGALPGPAQASAGDRMPLPGLAAWGVRLARIRAGPTGGVGHDREKIWPIVWDHEEALFRDALPLLAPALSLDGPHPPAARGRVA